MDVACGRGADSRDSLRLFDFRTQERYYTKIVERYMTFCCDAGERDELLRRFASLELKDTASSAVIPAPASLPALSRPTPGSDSTKPLSDLMMALRKLREGIVASKRADDFALQVYLFNIRLAVLTKHPESYHPAILHVLQRLHPLRSLTSVELQEVVAYLILDTACRRRDLAEAYALRHRYKLADGKVDAVLGALVHDDFAAFHRVKRSVDGHKARLMGFAEDEMRTRTLKCFGRTYLSVDKQYLEQCTGSTWDVLKDSAGVGWELDGDKVVIRKVKGR